MGPRLITWTVAMALCVCAALPSMAQAGFGPPGGPTTPPFWQCPAVGTSTSCSFLVDLTGSASSPTATVYADRSQEFYDAGKDDEIVAVQNDTSGVISSVHLGVANSGDNLFGFEGDGLCNPGVGATPTGCPFGGTSSTSDPFDYYGPDMSFTLDPSSTDDGTVNFNPPLQPGQYTFFALDAPFGEVVIPAGNVNDYLTTLLTDANNTSGATSLSESTPISVTDQATLNGNFTNTSSATGTIFYKVYKDPQCTQQVVDATPSPNTVVSGSIPPSNAVGSSSSFPTNATYYWQVQFVPAAGDPNSQTITSCGDETMTFGTPPARPSTGIQTTLSDGTHSGPQLSVAPNTRVTDSATITGTAASSATGAVTYLIYSDSICSKQASAFPLHGDIRNVNNGSAPASAAVTLPVGIYYFRAVYSGDSSHASAITACGAEVLSVRNPTSIATALTASGNVAGATVTVQPLTRVSDTATVLVAGAVASGATGTVSYALYNAVTDLHCSKPPAAGSNAAVLGGTATPFQVPIKPGKWLIVAAYSGDRLNLPSASACGSEVITVLPAKATIKKTSVSKGTITTTLSVNDPGKIVITGVAVNARAVYAKAGRCRSGKTRIHGKCVSTLFGRASLTVTAAGTYKIKLHPDKAAKRALARRRTIKVKETITVKPDDGTKGKTTTVIVKVRRK